MDDPLSDLSDPRTPDLSDTWGGVQGRGLFELQTLGWFSALQLLGAVFPEKSTAGLLGKDLQKETFLNLQNVMMLSIVAQ